MDKILGYCKDCAYYEYQDTKYFPPNQSFNWGYCHFYIDKNTTVVGEEFDLIEYFERRENDYCSKFKKGMI
jgi:hypothetical protein